ncbi:MAG: sulfurtransferase TusA family protein [Acidiphilium sp.]|nr:sulfurtransferase TusA family protein [Acidiphilium sp.]MDD4935679.1 sulfurtransferase TusA family protein [Acidiphilium sp.]
MADTMLDAKYLKGPMPVLRAARALRALAVGDKLRVLATDPGTVVDFRDFCRDSGHALISCSELKGVFSFTIRCGTPRLAQGRQS